MHRFAAKFSAILLSPTVPAQHNFPGWYGLADLDGVLYCGVGGAALADGYLASWLVCTLFGRGLL